jgi:DNA primase
VAACSFRSTTCGGRVAGFGGRLLGPGEPKYLNSPESPIFHKGKQLYNLHQAKGAIRKEETVILVEGYFDVLRLLFAGVDHVVAPLGTALTSDQASLLRRYAPSATLLYDSDQAGLRATFRAGDELLRHGMRVRVATLPPGEDPDTLVKQGGVEALETILSDAMGLMERKIQLLEQKGWFEGEEHQREALDRLLPTIRAASDPITRDLYIKAVSDRTGVSREAIQQQLSARPERTPAPRSSPSPSTNGPETSRPTSRPARRRQAEFSAEGDLLRVLMRDRAWLARALDEVPPQWFETPPLREVYDALRRSPENVGSPVFLEQLSPEGLKAWTWLGSVEPKYGTPNLDRMYVDACRTLEARPLRRRLDALAARRRDKLGPEEFDTVVREELQLKQQLASLFPEELLKRTMRRGRLDAR